MQDLSGLWCQTRCTVVLQNVEYKDQVALCLEISHIIGDKEMHLYICSSFDHRNIDHHVILALLTPWHMPCPFLVIIDLPAHPVLLLQIIGNGARFHIFISYVETTNKTNQWALDMFPVVPATDIVTCSLQVCTMTETLQWSIMQDLSGLWWQTRCAVVWQYA